MLFFHTFFPYSWLVILYFQLFKCRLGFDNVPTPYCQCFNISTYVFGLIGAFFFYVEAYLETDT